MSDFDPERIRGLLRSLSVERPQVRLRTDRFPSFEPGAPIKPAAVLIPFTQTDQGFEIVMTQRSAELRKHAGQVAFPGGKRDKGDDSLAFTALRETHEEIGLAPEDVQVYGALLNMPTVTAFDVTVFAGEFKSPYPLEANPAEIDSLFSAPLAELADPSIHRVEERVFEGETYSIHYFDYGEHLVWGATGLMLETLLKFLGLR